MESRFLESFVTVADLGSIAEAARHLRLTPAAIAQRIRALEGDIGRPLLARAGRNVRLTLAGTAILAEARRLVREVDGLAMLAAADLPFGELRIGATPSALISLLPPALVTLRERYPGIEVIVRSGDSDELYSAVLAGELDAALLIRQSRTPKSANWQELRREPLVVLAAADNPATDAAAALAASPFIRYDRRRWGGKMAEGWLRTNRIAVDEWVELDSLEAIAILVSHGLGVSLVPDWAPPWMTSLRLRKLALDPPVPFRSLGMLWDRSSPRLSLIRTLREALPGFDDTH